MGGYVCAVDSEVCSVTGFLFSQLMGGHWSYTIFILRITLRQIFFCGVSELRGFIRFSFFSRKQTTRHCSLFDLLFFLQKKLICIFFAYLVFLFHQSKPRLILLFLYILCRPLFVWGWNTVKLNLLALSSYFQLSFTNTLTFFFKCMLFLSQDDKGGEMHL